MNPLEDGDPLSRRGFLVGTAGAAAVAGVSATALAQEDEEEEGQEDEEGEEGDGEEGEGEDGEGEEGEEGEDEEGEDGEGEDEDGGGGGGTETVEVGDDFFEPESLTVEPGTTVVWEWVGDHDHNVAPSSQPDDADWEGHPDLQSDGEYEHTFDVEGTYDYICEPHVGLGMEGSIIVDPDGGGGEAAGPADIVPDGAWTIIIATVAGMVSTLSLVYFFMRYGGESH